MDNMIALLEQSDRVCQINLMGIPTLRYFERLLEGMQKPLPELTDLTLWSLNYATMSVVPDSFLGGYAPRLRELSLDRVPFPGLPKLILSATNLVSLHLLSIPNSGYILPEAMLTALSSQPISDHFTLDSNPLDLTLTGQANIGLLLNSLSSPYSWS